MGCYESRPTTAARSDHKKGKNTELSQRLIEEVSLLNEVTRCMNLARVDEALSKVSEYYAAIRCKPTKDKKGKGVCILKPKGAWCFNCDNLGIERAELAAINAINDRQLYREYRLKVTLVGPEESPYVGRLIKTTIYFTSEYPRSCPTLHVDDDIYHINIHAKTRKVMFKRILPKNWNDGVRLLQILIEFIRVLIKPDDSTQYFKTPENAIIFKQYKDNRRDYMTIAATHAENLKRAIPGKDYDNSSQDENI